MRRAGAAETSPVCRSVTALSRSTLSASAPSPLAPIPTRWYGLALPWPEASAPVLHTSKSRILNAALDVFRLRGYAATTVDDICASAGLTKGSFFHHFSSKDELALAAADHFGAMATRLFAEAPYHQLEDPRDRVLGYIDFRVAILRGALPQFTCLLGTLVQEVYDSHPAIRAACDRHISAHAQELAKDIALAKRIHAPRAAWSPESLAFHTQATLQGAFVLAKAKGGPAVAAECLSHLRRYIELLLETSTDTPRARRSRASTSAPTAPSSKTTTRSAKKGTSA